MRDEPSLDGVVRARLREWPQRPPGISQQRSGTWRWLRGRPGDETVLAHPYLKFPGSARLRTLPDGLWLNFGGSPEEPFVDIFAIEACATMSNLLDKRSRFAPSTQSFLAVCPVVWLLAPIAVGDPTPRWRATGVLRAEPTAPLVLPIRDVRVMYALRSEHYRDFARNQVPQPHEYFLPMDRLTQYDAHQDPAVRALVSRASVTSNFFDPPS